MTSVATRHWMMAALIALIVSMMAIATTVDAAACGAEISAIASTPVLDTADADADGSAPATEAGDACSHGHVHHGGLVLPDKIDAGSTLITAARSGRRLSADPLASRAPAGPERPPRA